jgi:hypothetical protein
MLNDHIHSGFTHFPLMMIQRGINGLDVVFGSVSTGIKKT